MDTVKTPCGDISCRNLAIHPLGEIPAWHYYMINGGLGICSPTPVAEVPTPKDPQGNMNQPVFRSYTP